MGYAPTGMYSDKSLLITYILVQRSCNGTRKAYKIPSLFPNTQIQGNQNIYG